MHLIESINHHYPLRQSLNNLFLFSNKTSATIWQVKRNIWNDECKTIQTSNPKEMLDHRKLAQCIRERTFSPSPLTWNAVLVNIKLVVGDHTVQHGILFHLIIWSQGNICFSYNKELFKLTYDSSEVQTMNHARI